MTVRTSVRSRRALAIAALVGFAIVVLNLALWLLYRDTRTSLETELARRLENVAVVLAQTIDSELVLRAADEFHDSRLANAPSESLFATPAYDALRSLLVRIADETDLANVRLFDSEGLGFLDLAAPPLSQTESLDPAGVFAALTGAAGSSELYQSGNEYLMAGYAPVASGDGLALAALAVEADARFFGALRRLRFAMFASALLSALVLVGLGVLFARMQASLAHAQDAVQRAESLAAMGRMAAGIAHEIRNPLGIIRATAARLKKRYADPEEPDEKFDYIADEVDRLNSTLSGYLSFARDEAPRLENLDFVPILDRCLRFMTPEFEGPGVHLEVDLPTTCPVRGDAQRLQQVVMNLVLNSVQAMPQGGRLRIRLGVEGDHVHLTFSDSGPGVPAEARNRLFEPFYTTKEKGSGLGLAIVRRIIEQHGGRITLGSAEEGGARVEIRLPAV